MIGRQLDAGAENAFTAMKCGQQDLSDQPATG